MNSDIVVSFHCKLEVKRCLENDEIERQLKYKICDAELCIFGCFKKYHTKARFSYWMRGGEACIYIQQISTKNICTLNFTLFKNKYLGLCVSFY
jgi:hypothetical protein